MEKIFALSDGKDDEEEIRGNLLADYNLILPSFALLFFYSSRHLRVSTRKTAAKFSLLPIIFSI
jgi:hypothetical protein